MSYSNITALNLIYSSPTFAPYDVLLEILIKSRSNSFQTQAGRDILREQLVNALQTVVTPTTRFPANRWYVWSRNPTLGPVFEALLQATDTKNRIIETEHIVTGKQQTNKQTKKLAYAAATYFGAATP